jgi:hypothetical protein
MLSEIYFILDTFHPDVRFEVLMAVTMKSAIFWDVAPCSLVEVN